MPNRHFLRRDYLHIFFYLKFLVFVSLAPQINSYLTPILINCGFRIVRKKEQCHIPDATTEQMGYGIVSFFVYTKSTNYYLSSLIVWNCLYSSNLFVILS